MATRSSISIKTPEGKYRSIYCHWDGYPSYVGRVLKEDYKEVDKINRLIDLGDISSLREEVETDQPHSYDTPVNNVTVAYGRDRGETDVEFKIFENIEDIKKWYNDSEYHYVYDEGWKLISRGKLVEYDENED